MNLEKCDGNWRFDDGKFVIGNSVLDKREDGDHFFWEKTYDLSSGTIRNKYSRPLNTLNREMLNMYMEQEKVTLKNNRSDFFKRFYENLEDPKQNKYFKSKNYSIDGLNAKQYEGKTVIKMVTFDDPTEYAGFLFVDDNGKTHKIVGGNKDAVVYFKQKEDNLIFFATGIDDGLVAYKLVTKGSVAICYSEKDMELLVNKYSSKYYDDIVIALCRNPDGDTLSKNEITPVDFFREQQDKFSGLNVFVKNPPFGGETSVLNFNNLYQINQNKCLRYINSIPDDFPSFKVLGCTGKAVFVWSSNLEIPMEISEFTKYATLLLIAPSNYYKQRFKTENPKIIVNKLFEIARGKKYNSEKIKYAGLYKNTKNELIINTGKKVIGNPDKDDLFLKVGTFPEPKKGDGEIKVEDFAFLYEKVFKNICFKNQEEGLSIFSWTILSLFTKALPARFPLHLFGDSSSGKNFTRDDIISPLLKDFNSIVRRYNPGCTFASFKYDLRDEGAYVFFFEEAEGKTYDDKITKLIRSATYEDASITQINTKSGGKTSTPAGFMALSTFNYEKDNFSQPDSNRTYEVNYSLSRLDQSSKSETIDALLKINLEKLGRDCFFKIYFHWNDFLSYYNKSKFDINKFGLVVNGHKRNVFAQLYAFYKVTGLLSDEELDKYVDFLNRKEKVEGFMDFNNQLVDSVLRVPLYDKEGFKKIQVRGLLDDVCAKQESGFANFAKWMRHICYTYRIKVQRRQNGDLFLYLPCRSPFIVKGLITQGYSVPEAKSYTNIIESEYSEKRSVRYSEGDVRTGVGIPLDKICNTYSYKIWKEITLKDVYMRSNYSI